jgi:CRP-like cAMP-binding protein
MRGLDHRGLLLSLSPRARADLSKLGASKRFQPGEALVPRVLFAAPPALPQAVVILEGLVKVTVVSAGGHETLLSFHGAGELLGEAGAIRSSIPSRGDTAATADSPRRVATALTPVRALVIMPANLRLFLDGHPEAYRIIALAANDRLEEAASRLASAGRDSAGRRLAALLCDLESYGTPQAEPAGTRLPFRLSHADLAAWAGTCQETVGRSIRDWRHREIVSSSRGLIVVHDLEALARIAGIRVNRRAWGWGDTAAWNRSLAG